MATSPPLSRNRQLAHHEAVTEMALAVARPLFWHDARAAWPKRLRGGSCFVLRFSSGLVGVTAEHVVSAFEREAKSAVRPICLLRTVPIDLGEALIDRDPELDIATFRVTETELIGSQAMALDCTAAWPPPAPSRGTALSVSGFPEDLQEEGPPERYTFHAYCSLCHAEDVTNLDIVATYDPARDFRAIASPQLADLGANLSGCSGGPLLMHVVHNGLHRIFPVALVMKAVPFTDFDLYRFRRLHFIQPDGTLCGAHAAPPSES
jgi:hypothetical protein